MEIDRVLLLVALPPYGCCGKPAAGDRSAVVAVSAQEDELTGKIINQAGEPGGHGGARKGAGRPAGKRSSARETSEADAAAAVARLELVDVLLLAPTDILRLAMLLALRRGDLEAAADHARRLLPSWQPWQANTTGAMSRSVLTVNRLVRELHDPTAEPADGFTSWPEGAA